eukprot:Stramenopile-MAST_4_protein_2063
MRAIAKLLWCWWCLSVPAAAGKSAHLHVLGPDNSVAVLSGTAFGYHGQSTPLLHELVFSTAMTGYVESLTDPSYAGQILILSYPIVGIYGVPSNASNVDDGCAFLARNGHQSLNIQVAGLIVSSLGENHFGNKTTHHWEAVETLSKWMARENVPGMYGVDTRALILKLRRQGGLRGIFSRQPFLFPLASLPQAAQDPKILVPQWTCGTCQHDVGSACVRIAILDLGVKHAIPILLLRLLRSKLGAHQSFEIVVLPRSIDLAEEMTKRPFSGLLVSNGPGDPALLTDVVAKLARIVNVDPSSAEYSSGLGHIPILGICLGHQLIALAAGGATSKLKFGHRGHNHPVLFGTSEAPVGFMSSQNHGYVVNPVETTPAMVTGWKAWFLHLNDNTNAGMFHRTKPIMSVQFHPEGKGGPTDPTDNVFGHFVDSVVEFSASATVSPSRWPPAPPRATIGSAQLARPTRVLLLGSGGLQIGQAGEFDYSGSQALKALRSLGIETILLNPNVASVQTQPGMADEVVFGPLDVPTVVRILQTQRPDAILLSFGGQTALNLGMELNLQGILRKYNVRVLGTQIEGILKTEDREKFKQMLDSIGQPMAASATGTTRDEIVVLAENIGYPVLLRRAFALGGYGSGFARNRDELEKLVSTALARTDPGGAPPQMIVDRSLKGWKEVEYEVVRDALGNCIIVCNMENFDPLGVHTGESIVVAPSQTLSDTEYQSLRTASLRIAEEIQIVGECNIQFAVHPEHFEYVVVEVNPRLSRSSALASKATGYPIAAVAAQLSVGVPLPSIVNSMTQASPAFFEPALDYLVVKVPNWDFHMFDRIVDQSLNTGMKSIGEVMAIGKTFSEAFQKAMRMVGLHPRVDGFDALPTSDEGSCQAKKGACFSLHELLRTPSPLRPLYIASAFEEDWGVEKISLETGGIDSWFLSQLYDCHRVGKLLNALTDLSELRAPLLMKAKRYGFSDKQIAARVGIGVRDHDVRALRLRLKIRPRRQKIDTTAGEFPAQSNYYFLTYDSMEDPNMPPPPSSGAGPVLILGSGVYRIGSSIEFDHAVVSCVRIIRNITNRPSIVLNYNPETVSTDYDESDSLYFEEISVERVLDVLYAEQAKDVVVSMGGQTAQNLVPELGQMHDTVNILGTPADGIERAENRKLHSEMLDDLGIDQAEWISSADMQSLTQFSETAGYPVLVRPSFVLAGAAMQVVYNHEELKKFLNEASEVSPHFPVVVSKYEENSQEIDVDAVARRGEVEMVAVVEHVEQAGVHSGDAVMIFPPQKLPPSIVDRCQTIAKVIARELGITGPFNLQIIYNPQMNTLKVIETNLRASRSMPFVSRATGINFCEEATLAIMGLEGTQNKLEFGKQTVSMAGIYAVKSPVFSFERLPGADVLLGVTMKATGEVAAFDADPYVALLASLRSAGRVFPVPPAVVCLSLPAESNARPDGHIRDFVNMLKTMNYSTRACSNAASQFWEIDMVAFHGMAAISAHLATKQIHVIVDISKSEDDEQYQLRRLGVDFSVPVFTSLPLVLRTLEATRRALRPGSP